MLHIFNKSCQLTNWQGATRILLLAVTSLVLFGTNGAEAASTCGTCHEAIPVDGTATRNNPAGRFFGSHSKHAGTLSMACTDCHTSNTAMTHSNGTIEMAANGATYSKGTSFAINYAATLTGGTCASLYCHSNGQNLAPPTAPRTVPIWGATLVCSDCHGNSNTTLISGSHAKHVAGATCEKCHYLTANGPNSLKNIANHANGLINMAFEINSSATSSAQYGGVATPRSKTPDNGASYGVCTNILCHSNGQGIWSNTVGLGTTPTWGTTGGCGACHGNATYSTDYRRAAPLYTDGSPKPNSHRTHVDGRASLTGNETQCKHCHATVTASNSTVDGTAPTNHANGSYSVAGGSSYRNGDTYGTSTTPVAVTVNYSYVGTPGVSTCANVSCHPTGLGHADKASTSVAWNDSYACTDCHKIDLQSTSGYHHALRNYSGAPASANYPTTVPQGNATSGTNSQSRRCTMCHVDHNIFSPMLNASNTNGRAYNLRTNIASQPTASTGYTNSDYIGGSGSSGGICITCHNAELTKSTTKVLAETNSTKTAAIGFTGYSGSAHEYAVASAMKSPDNGGTFQSNCSKCHNGRRGEVSVFSSLTTATHDNPVRRIYASLGQTSLTDGNDSNFCYRCHSHQADNIGGNKKPTDGKDYYATATMRASAENIFGAVAGTPASSTSITNTLYFKPSTEYTPPGTLPTAHLNTSDAFNGGTFVARGMAPTAPTVTYETQGAAVTVAAGTQYWRRVSFISPLVATATNTTAANWAVNIYDRESSANANSRVRYSIYTIDSTGAFKNQIVARADFGTEMGTTAAPGAQQAITAAGSAIAIAVNDRIVVDLEISTVAVTTGGSYTMAYYFGSGATSNVVMPNNIEFTYAQSAIPPTSAHNVGNVAYAGLHKPSPTDETFAYISANKHVSCNDCHDPHAARYGNRTDASAQGGTSIVLPQVLKGATGVATPTWPALWTAPAQSVYGTAPVAATMEWQICFKCHAGANSNVSTWGGSGAAAWTDLGLEFNPNNYSAHPIVTGLNSYPNSPAPKALTAAKMKAPWNTNLGTQVMACSDCHATDSTASKGPHGSSVKWMLTGTNKAWPYTTTAGNGASTGTLFRIATYNTGNGTADGLFCLNCHAITGSNNWHSNGDVTGGQHGGNAIMACVSCHIRVPHGGKISRLLQTTNAPARYKSNGNGATSNYTNFGPTTGTVKGSTLSSANFNSSCSDHSGTGGEAW